MAWVNADGDTAIREKRDNPQTKAGTISERALRISQHRGNPLGGSN